uniref:C2H2-type domain-containing protein n=2 Tax=Nothobranchius korthausae TaxID=1143690 RepID=A0A1A8FXN4_9TELE
MSVYHPKRSKREKSSTMEHISLKCQVCCSMFNAIFYFKQHMSSPGHLQKMKTVFPEENIDFIEYLPHIVFVVPRRKHELNPFVGLSLLTLCFGEFPTAFYLCHACEQYCTLGQIMNHVYSQEHNVNYFSYTNPDKLFFSWVPGRNMKKILALKSEQEVCKKGLQYLQVLHLPNELIKKCISKTYMEVMQTLSEKAALVLQFSARMPKRVTVRDYLNNSSRKHPLIGMQHVIECVCVGAGEMRHYLCTLCCLTIANRMIVNHILSFDHIYCYFKAWHPSTLMSKESYSQYRSVAPIMLNFIEQIKEIHGTESASMKEVSLQPDEFKTMNFTCYNEALKKLETITKSSLTTSIKPGKKLVYGDSFSQLQAFSKVLKVKLRCQNCSMVFETIGVYMKHFSQLQHPKMLAKYFWQAERQECADQIGKFNLYVFTYVCNTLKKQQLPHGTDMVIACVSSHVNAEPFYVCFACHESFPQPLMMMHFDSRKHLINTLMYQNPWRLPFGWKDNELDDDELRSLALKEEEEMGRDQIILKVLDIPYALFWTLDRYDYKQVLHKLELYRTLLRREVPPCRTFSKLQGNEKFPLLGKPFMVAHVLKIKGNEPKVGVLCLLCERRLSSDEIQAHVFSREHVTSFLNSIHPGSLNPSIDSEEAFLDLAKQAACIHPVSNMQYVQLESPILEPCSYRGATLLLRTVKMKEGVKSLEPQIRPMMKLVPRVAQREVEQNREEEGQTNRMDTDELENKLPKRVKVEVKVEEASESCSKTEERPNMEHRTTLQHCIQQKNERKRPNATSEKCPNEHLGPEMTPKRPRLISNDDSTPKTPAADPKSAAKKESSRISTTIIKLCCVGRETIVLCGSCSLKVEGVGHFTEIKHPKMDPLVVNLEEKMYNDISNQSFQSVIQTLQIQMLPPWSDGGCSLSSASPPSAGAAIDTWTHHCEDDMKVVDMELSNDLEGDATMPDSSARTETLCKTSQDQEFKHHHPRAGLVQPHRHTVTTTTTSLPPKCSGIVSPDTTVASLKYETSPRIKEEALTPSVDVCKSAPKEPKPSSTCAATVSDASPQSASMTNKSAPKVKSASGAAAANVGSRNGPRSAEASKGSAAASVPAANVAKPVDDCPSAKTSYVNKSEGEHANVYKRNSPTALSPNATFLSSSEHKNRHKDPPHVSAASKTPAGNLAKVGVNQLIVVMCEGKQQVYCRLCSVKLHSSSQYHLTNINHQLKYVKMKFPEWIARESELEEKLSHTVALLAKIEKDLPQIQNPQKLEVSQQEYINLGRLSEKKAVEKVKEMGKLKESHDLCPIADASGPSKLEICSPCEVSSSDDGMLVSRDEPMRCDQIKQEDKNQHQTAVVQLSGQISNMAHFVYKTRNFCRSKTEMESGELEDQNLAAGDSIKDQFLDDDDVICVTKPICSPGFHSEDVTEMCPETNKLKSPTEDPLLRRHVGEKVWHQQNPVLHSQSKALTEAEVVSDSRRSERRFAPERQRRKSDSCGLQDQSPPVQRHRLQLHTAASTSEQQNPSGPIRKAEAGEQRASQAQTTTLVGGKARGSSSLSLYLNARRLNTKHVIGMASVWECRGFGNLKTFYLCESCEMTLSRQDICQHMVSLDHQLKYLGKYHSEVMYWQELDDLPQKLQMDIFLNDIIQPIAERELTFKMDAQCFVLSPELYRLVWTSPFDKALKMVKVLQGEENPSLLSLLACASQQNRLSEDSPSAQAVERTQCLRRRTGCGDRRAQSLDVTPSCSTVDPANSPGSF